MKGTVNNYFENKDNLLPVYKDEGCNFHPSCLSCPEASCLLEDPIALARARKEQTEDRNKRIYFGWKLGKSITSLAKRYHTSEVNISRVLKVMEKQERKAS